MPVIVSGLLVALPLRLTDGTSCHLLKKFYLPLWSCLSLCPVRSSPWPQCLTDGTLCRLFKKVDLLLSMVMPVIVSGSLVALPQCLTDGTFVIYSRKSICLCGHACSIRNRTKAPSGLTHRVRPPACDSCFFLSYPLYVLTVIVSGSPALYHVSFYCVGSFCEYVSFACCRLVRLASIYWAHVTCT